MKIISLFFLLFPFIVHSAPNKVQSLFKIDEYEIVSASKKPENVFQTASSVYVITGDEINRLGLTSIAEALRVVPGLEVARIDSNKWAITSRGFNRQFVNKMLVMIDGRTVYSPLFSGTYWDVQDTNIKDIERIEVVKGPGAALWGSNAVNGVINIITKNSEFTQGNYVNTIVGNEERSITYRYGSKTDNFSYRVFGKATQNESSTLTNGNSANDNWNTRRAGFRIDNKSNLTISGEIYKGREDQDYYFPLATSSVDGTENFVGGHVITNYKKDNTEITSYIDYIDRDISLLDQSRITFDINTTTMKDFMNNEIIYGFGYRYFKDVLNSKIINGNSYLDYSPKSSNNHLFNLFIQNTKELIPNKLKLIAGTKLEHHYFTDYELQPNIRILYTPNNNNSLWASISKASRTPSRGERDISLVAGSIGNQLLVQKGEKTFDSEKMFAYEVGYRTRPSTKTYLDLSLFFNDYTDLRSFEFDGTNIIPLGNNLYGETYGAELSIDYRMTDDWLFNFSYNYLKINLHKKPGSGDISSESDENASPNNQFKVRSHYNYSKNLSFDNTLYYVGELEKHNINEYFRLDSSITWKPSNNLELSLVGQNLLDGRHKEFEPSIFSLNSEIDRSLYAKVSYSF